MSGFVFFLPVWSDLDVTLLCRFAHVLQGSISYSEMRSLKTQTFGSLSLLLAIQTLALTQRKDVVSNISGEAHGATLTKDEGRAKRSKRKGEEEIKHVLTDLFFYWMLHIDHPAPNLHQEGSRLGMASFCCTLACCHRCIVLPSGCHSVWRALSCHPVCEKMLSFSFHRDKH